MEFEQMLQACGDSPEKLGELAESLAGEIDLAYAGEDEARCADLHYRFSRLCGYARETLSPADYHRFLLKVESLENASHPPLV